MKIVYCGRLQDVAGIRSLEVDPPADVATAHAVRDWLTRDNPQLRAALLDALVRIVVNDAVAPGDLAVSPHDEIAFMPPVSGG